MACDTLEFRKFVDNEFHVEFYCMSLFIFSSFLCPLSLPAHTINENYNFLSEAERAGA